jgi:hypothetical protein
MLLSNRVDRNAHERCRPLAAGQIEEHPNVPHVWPSWQQPVSAVEQQNWPEGQRAG